MNTTEISYSVLRREKKLMLVKRSEVEERTIIEIGKFTILWNCFENYYCHNNCSLSKIRTVSSRITINSEQQKAFVEVIKKRRGILVQNINEYVEIGLHPGNARPSQESDKQLMKSFIEQNGDDLECGCLLIIYRLRNNLMHGLKSPEELNGQIELFQVINDILEHIQEQ